MNTDFEDKNAEEVERLADLVEKPKRGTAKQNNPNQKWSWLKVALPIIVAIIGALGLIIASGNGQVVVEIANSIFNNSDQPIMSTQVALALTQTSVKVIQDTASDATATHVAQLTPSPVPPSVTVTATSTRTPSAPITPMPTGKLVYNDEFEDGLAHQFSFFEGSWKVIDENTGNKVLEANTETGGANATFGPQTFTDGIVEFRFRVVNVDYQAEHHVMTMGIRTWWDASGDGTQYVLAYEPAGSGFGMSYQEKGGTWQSVEGISEVGTIQNPDANWITVRVEVIGQNIRVFVNGNHYMTVSDSRIAEGAIYLGVLGNMTVQFDDLKVWNTA